MIGRNFGDPFSLFDSHLSETVRETRTQYLRYDAQYLATPGARLVFDRFDKWIRQISYKKNVTFRYTLEGNRSQETINFCLIYKTVDSVQEKTLTEIYHSHLWDIRLVADWDFNCFKENVYLLIQKSEIHELNEFFKVDGVAEKDPHKNDPKWGK